MATSVKQIAEQITRTVNGASRNQSEKLSEKEVKIAVNQEWAYLAKTNYFENGKLDFINYLDNQFIAQFNNVDVLFDSNINQKYSILPDTPIGLPRTGGVMQVSGMGGLDNPFLPIDATAQGMFANLEAFCIPGRTYYYVQGAKVFYKNIGTMPRVNMLLASVNGDAQIPKEYETVIIDKLIQRFMTEKQIPQDKTNDGADGNDKV